MYVHPLIGYARSDGMQIPKYSTLVVANDVYMYCDYSALFWNVLSGQLVYNYSGVTVLTLSCTS